MGSHKLFSEDFMGTSSVCVSLMWEVSFALITFDFSSFTSNPGKCTTQILAAGHSPRQSYWIAACRGADVWSLPKVQRPRPPVEAQAASLPHFCLLSHFFPSPQTLLTFIEMINNQLQNDRYNKALGEITALKE